MPARSRAAVKALFAIDAAMGDVLRTTSEPGLGQIRLAWWRERLEELDKRGAPAEPRLRAVRQHLVPRGVAASGLAALETGWLAMFDPFPWGDEVAEAIANRGQVLFGIAAKIITQDSENIADAGGMWAMVDVARRCSDRSSREILIRQARQRARRMEGKRFQVPLRPLSMLAALSLRDAQRGAPFEPEGTPRRAWAMAQHRLTGVLPRSRSD